MFKQVHDLCIWIQQSVNDRLIRILDNTPWFSKKLIKTSKEERSFMLQHILVTDRSGLQLLVPEREN